MRLDCPYLREGFVWLRGNLHTHTTHSDGELPPDQTIARYQRAGYGFLSLTDHDCLVDPEPYRTGTSLVLIPGVEVSARGPHLLGLGVRQHVEPTADRQRAIDMINGQGGIAVLNHPNWLESFNHWPQEAMQQLERYAGIEIYNAVVEFLEGSALALDRWDRLLSAGKRVWGFANDDWHVARQPLLAWNVVQAVDRTPEAVLEALRNGRFYASTGVTITRVEAEGDMVHVESPDAQCIRFIGVWGRELEAGRPAGPVAEARVTERAGPYIRAECYGAGMQRAWTQPIWVEP